MLEKQLEHYFTRVMLEVRQPRHGRCAGQDSYSAVGQGDICRTESTGQKAA